MLVILRILPEHETNIKLMQKKSMNCVRIVAVLHSLFAENLATCQSYCKWRFFVHQQISHTLSPRTLFHS